MTKAQALTPERERWVEASTLLRIHGQDAPRFVAARIGALALLGDAAGVERMTAIADRMDKLMRPDIVQ